MPSSAVRFDFGDEGTALLGVGDVEGAQQNAVAGLDARFGKARHRAFSGGEDEPVVGAQKQTRQRQAYASAGSGDEYGAHGSPSIFSVSDRRR